MKNTHFVLLLWLFFPPKTFSAFNVVNVVKRSWLKKTTPRMQLVLSGSQVEFPHSLTWLSWEDLGQKRQSLSQVPALQPRSGGAGQGWAASLGCELSLRQEFCAVPFRHVPVPPHSSSTLRAEASSDSVQNDKGKVRVCRSLCSGSQQIPKGRAGPFPFPSQDVLDAADLFHHFTCLSPAADTAPPLREDRTRTFLTHRAAKPQTLHLTPFIALVERNTWRD